jgi:hypothetical protein
VYQTIIHHHEKRHVDDIIAKGKQVILRRKQLVSNAAVGCRFIIFHSPEGFTSRTPSL